MKKFLIFFSLIFIYLNSRGQITQDTQMCILQVIANKKGVKLDSNKQVPVVIFAKDASLTEFNNDIFPQWGQKLDEITNVYIVASNKIYIVDDATYYEKHGRFIEDSLAHEYVHYLQVIYQNTDILKDETGFIELEAIDLQNWYRKTYSSASLDPCQKLP